MLNEPTQDFSFRCKLALSKEAHEILEQTEQKKSNRKSSLDFEIPARLVDLEWKFLPYILNM